MSAAYPSRSVATAYLQKFAALRKQFLQASTKILCHIDVSIQKLRILNERVESLPNNYPQKKYARQLLALYILYRPEIASFFTNNISEIDLWCKKFRHDSKFVIEDTHYQSSPYFLAILKVLNKKYIAVPITKPVTSKLMQLLHNVPFDPDTKCGCYLSDLQNTFETLVILRNPQYVRSLIGLESAMKTNISFSSIEGFVRAMTSKIISDFQITNYVPQLMLCVQRVVYSRVYTYRPDFFPFSKVNSLNRDLARDTPVDIDSFTNGVDHLNRIMFQIAPVDILYSLYVSSTLFVDSYMIVHNMGAGVDFGAEQLLPIIEKGICQSYVPCLVDILLWLDKYCEENSMPQAISYVVTSFLIVAGVMERKAH